MKITTMIAAYKAIIIQLPRRLCDSLTLLNALLIAQIRAIQENSVLRLPKRCYRTACGLARQKARWILASTTTT